MEVMDLLRERKSVRTFLDKKIDDDVKDLLYEAAFEAPTAGCQMFYSIIEVKDERLIKLSELYKPQSRRAP